MNQREASAGLVLGGFRLEERVGVGGMGEVWRARNVKSEKFVRAIKVIRPELAADPQFHKRFLREAEYLEVLQHPNILRVENLGDDNGLLFMVMELLQGRSVDEWLEGKKASQSLPTVAEACGVMTQVLSGVVHAHANGVIHRDLKPPNFFLTATGNVKVLDFGIARHGDLNTRVTKTTQGVPGSPGYYAPEFSDGKEASPASDVYALGISFFELLAGRWPFLPGGSTQDQATLSLLIQHATKAMPDLRAFRSDVPGELAAITQRAGAKDPQARPSAEELRAVLAGFAGPAAASPSGGRGVSPASAATPSAVQQPVSTSFAIAAMGAPRQATPAKAPLSTSFDVGAMPRSEVASAAPPGAAAAPPVVSKRNRGTLAYGSAIFVAAVGLGGAGVWWSSQSANAPHVPTIASKPSAAGDAGVRAPMIATAPEGMAAIPSGIYVIGADDRSPFEGPLHRVRVEAFFIDKTEVSVGAVRAFVAANKSVSWTLPPRAADSKPVSNVSVEQAQAFCAWKIPGGRLPTEDEWEASARGVDGRAWPWGREPNAACVHQNQGSDGFSVPVDAHPCGATPEGLQQLLGNVAEWTGTPPAVYPGSTAPVLKVFSQPGRFIVRGGSFDENSMEVSVTARSVRKSGDSDTNFDVGFRCAAPWPSAGPTTALEKAEADAEAALGAQEYHQALQLYRAALKLSPDDPRLRSGLGIALVMSDTAYKEAIPYLTEAVRLDPTNADAWRALGIAFQNLGRDAEAKTPYLEFLKLKPKGAEADEVRAALQAIP